jgi:hypothetical protein
MISCSRKRSSRARETPTFEKTGKNKCSLARASYLRSRPRPDSSWISKENLRHSAAKCIFFGDARLMLPVEENDCSDKLNPLGKVSSRARETTFFKALENSERGNCHLAHTKHLLLSSLE